LAEGGAEERADVINVVFWVEASERNVDDKAGELGAQRCAEAED
jgi:hypothetical protein